MSDYQMFEVQVSQVEPLTEQVKRFTLVATDGKPLPAFTGGSHIIVQMSDGDNQYSNAYSLLSSPHDTSCYQIAVRLEENSRGGSRFLHQQVKVGVWGSDQFWAEFVQPGRTCKPCVARGVVI